MKTARKKKNNALSTVLLLIAALCLLMLVFQGGIRLWGARTNRQVQELFYGNTATPSLTEQPTAEPEPTDAAAETAQPELTPEPTPAEETVYAANPLLDITPEPTAPVMGGEYTAVRQPREAYLPLLEKNPDTVGWLKVSDIIDFAVVQRDNAYYLSHDFFGRISAEGAAFLDEGATIEPEDQHLIIHGHNMRNGNIFGDLDLYRDLGYLKRHPVITFNTLYENCVYVPIAVFDISANPGHEKYMELQQFNFETADDFEQFVQDARYRSFYDIPVDVAPDDRLLSLVTCSYYDDNGRMVFMMRAVRPGESAEELAQTVQNAIYK